MSHLLKRIRKIQGVRRSRLFILMGFITSLFACASGELVIVTTPPEADIRARVGSGLNYESIGKSPLRITGKELAGRLGGDGPMQIEVAKEGYDTKELIISESPRSFDISFSIELISKAEKSKEEDEVNKIKEREAINHTVDSLFEIQRLVKVGRLDEALVKIRSLQDAEPNVAASYEMQGGIFYIQNDYPRALDAYQKALRLNPENVDSFNMKKYLESLTNTSSNKKLGQL